MPVWMGDRLILASPADAEYILADPRAIVLDAGRVFGTGTHPTTRMCLLELDANLESGDRVLDVGTGSGILALAAGKLGAKKAVAIDLSLPACRVARANVTRNGLGGVVSIVSGTPECLGPAGRFDLVVANLESATDARYWLGALSRLCRSGGKLILSGFQAPQEGLLLMALGEVNLAQRARRAQETWVTLVLGKNP
jgi:ribosomal protein L11 methyltransferase